MTDPANQNAHAHNVRPGMLGWRPYQYYLLLILFLAAVSNYLDRMIVNVLQEPMKHDLLLSDWELGLLGGPAFGLFYSLAGIPLARVGDRVPRNRLLAIILAIWSGMTALCGAAQSFVQLALCRFAVGAAEGGAVPISQALLTEEFERKQRGMIMSILTAAAPIASILATVAGAFLAQAYGWRVAFLVVGLPGIVLAILVWFTLREPRQQSRAQEAARSSFMADARWLMEQPAFVFIFAASALQSMAANGIGLFKVSFMLRSLDLELKDAGIVMAGVGLAGLVGVIVGGWASDRFSGTSGRSYFLVPAVGGVITALSYLIAFNATAPLIAIAGLVTAGFAFSMKNGPLFAAVQNIVPSTMRDTGAAVFMMSVTFVGTVAGPPVVGGISDALAAAAFDLDGTTFALACPAGLAPAGASKMVVDACRRASEQGLRSALISVVGLFVLASLCLVIAAMKFRSENDD